MDVRDTLRARQSSFRHGVPSAGIERMEALLYGSPFAAHRHDTYAVGIVLSGILHFRYRGVQRQCLPGEIHVLHPDELHDGRDGGGDGVRYRILYLDPALIRAASESGSLPFVREPVVQASQVSPNLAEPIWRFEETADDDAVTGVAALLDRFAGTPISQGRLPIERLARVREAIVDDPARHLSISALADIAGLDRWTLARRFRDAFGTSPSRFRLSRQLDLARELLRQGMSPAQAALEAGFGDQSHLTRRFKQAHGLAPVAWARASSPFSPDDPCVRKRLADST